MLHAVPYAFQVYVDNAIEVFAAAFDDRSLKSFCAGIIESEVETPEFANGALNRAANLIL
jgi:hypothetical protein